MKKRVGNVLVKKINNKYLLKLIEFLGSKKVSVYTDKDLHYVHTLTTIMLFGQHYFYSFKQKMII